LIELLQNRTAAEAMGERAKQVFDRQAGATARCVKALRELLCFQSNSEQLAGPEQRP